MIPRKPGPFKQPREDLVTLPSGHKVPASSLKQSDTAPRSGPVFERLPGVSGSIAGANSRFLADYYKHREKERRRLAAMDTEAAREEGRAAMEIRKAERQRELEEEASRKRDRRQKRKFAKSAEAGQAPADGAKQSKVDHTAQPQLSSEAASAQPERTPARPVVIRPLSSSANSSQIRIVDEDDF